MSFLYIVHEMIVVGDSLVGNPSFPFHDMHGKKQQQQQQKKNKTKAKSDAKKKKFESDFNIVHTE